MFIAPCPSEAPTEAAAKMTMPRAGSRRGIEKLDLRATRRAVRDFREPTG
jgi:hypothetical protein